MAEKFVAVSGKTVPVERTHIPVAEQNVNNNLNESHHQKSPEQKELNTFMLGEDVLIKRKDKRFYLGTIIENIKFQQYRIRFDDNTEMLCRGDEIRKLRTSLSSTMSPSSSLAMDGSPASENSLNFSSCGIVNDCHNNNNYNVVNFNDFSNSQPMCVVCKRNEPEMKVERCERCGRGYHYRCTLEASPNTDGWWCKRCSKPMKLSPGHSAKNSRMNNVEQSSSYENNKISPKRKLCFSLPYNVSTF